MFVRFNFIVDKLYICPFTFTDEENIYNLVVEEIKDEKPTGYYKTIVCSFKDLEYNESDMNLVQTEDGLKILHNVLYENHPCYILMDDEDNVSALFVDNDFNLYLEDEQC